MGFSPLPLVGGCNNNSNGFSIKTIRNMKKPKTNKITFWAAGISLLFDLEMVSRKMYTERIQDQSNKDPSCPAHNAVKEYRAERSLLVFLAT